MISVRDGSIQEVEMLLRKIPEFVNPYALSVLEDRLANVGIILVAELDGDLAGFKCGYPNDKDSTTFYSWLGGVIEKHRQKGIALALLKNMEARCRHRKFDWLMFKTLNEHKNMMIFAIKNGFKVDQVVDSRKDDRKRIIFKKKL